MDSTDVRIFVEMAFKELSYVAFADRHVSPAEIGRKLGMDEKTVRVRVRRMEDSGFIKYYQAIPNVALLGLRSMGSYRFEAYNLPTKFALIEEANEIPGLLETSDFLGPYISAEIAGKSSSDVLETAKGLAMRYELDMKTLGSKAVREPLRKPDHLDWQVVQKLRYDARAETKEIARLLSVTPRMAAYRISKLLDSGAVSVRAVIDVRKQEGLMFYELEVAVEEARRASVVRSLQERFGERVWAIKTPSATVLVLSLFGFTLGEPEVSVMTALEIQGVKRCSLFILKEVIEPRPPSWVDALIEEKITA